MVDTPEHGDTDAAKRRRSHDDDMHRAPISADDEERTIIPDFERTHERAPETHRELTGAEREKAVADMATRSADVGLTVAKAVELENEGRLSDKDRAHIFGEKGEAARDLGITLKTHDERQTPADDERNGARSPSEARQGVETPEPGSKRPSIEKGDLPASVASRYLTEHDALGNVALHKDAKSVTPAFVDHGDKLTAPETNKTTIRDMIETAEHRQWSSIVVKGDPEFKREAWLEASQRGLEVKGYNPTERDLQELERLKADRGPGEPRGPERSIEPTRERDQDRSEAKTATPQREQSDFSKGVTGTLVERGRSPYLDRPGNKEQPFVTLDVGGKLEKVWGAKLGDALDKSGAQPGDTVSVRRMERENVTIKDRGQPREVTRNVWQVTADKFRHGTPEQVARDPALKGAQGALKAFEAMTAGMKPQEQKVILDRAKEQIATGLERGSKFNPPKVRDMQLKKGAPTKVSPDKKAATAEKKAASPQKAGADASDKRGGGPDRRPSTPTRSRDR